MPHQVELIIRMMFLTTGLICLGYAPPAPWLSSGRRRAARGRLADPTS